jgi:hypothetical protein
MPGAHPLPKLLSYYIFIVFRTDVIENEILSSSRFAKIVFRFVRSAS